LFEHLAKRNIEAFQQAGVKNIVTLSPHGYNAFKNLYPQWGGHFSVHHYTHLLAEILPADKLPDREASRSMRRVTFHDPCYLGRHNKDFDTARSILDRLPGIERVEMPRNRADSLCCGGGGGNFFTDLVCSGPDTSTTARVEEAADTGAQVLVTACPICTVMLEDAVKARNLEQRLEVRELSELVAEDLG
jgi:Fe-S oxidoreductase